MIFERGVFCGTTVYGDEAKRLFGLYENDGIEYVAVDTNRDGTIGGLIQLAGVAANFGVRFDSAREAIRYARLACDRNSQNAAAIAQQGAAAAQEVGRG